MINESLLTPVHNAQENPRLEFYEGQCMFRMVSQGGTTIERLISWESVREAATGIPVDSGWLGPEVVRWGTGRLGEWAVAFIPPGRHQLELTDGTPGESETLQRIVAPLPGMVIFTIALKAFVWAVMTDTLNPHMEVYRAPLPNVYPANIEVGAERVLAGEVCWGLLKPEQASPRTILKTWQLFINSTFNNHCASGRSKRQREDIRVLLKKLAAAGETARYPTEDLIRQVEPAGVTLDRCIREFFETGEMPE